MRLKPATDGKEVPYRAEAGGGQLYEGRMPRAVAEEILLTAESTARSETEGFEVAVNGRLYFPLGLFEVEEGELPPQGPPPTKAELTAEAKKLGVKLPYKARKAEIEAILGEARS